MLPRPELSIVIPCRNMERFIEETLRCAQAQRLVEIELIIVDDGSTDRSRQILDEAASRDPRITVVDGPGIGVSAARNTGSAMAQAPILLFLDGDDLLAPDSVARYLATLEKSPQAVAALGGITRIDVNGRQLPGKDNRDLVPKDHDLQLKALLRKNFIANPGSFAIRAAAFNEAGRFDTSLTLGEDWALWCKLLLQGPIAVVPGPPSLSYRQVPGGANSRPRWPFAPMPSIDTISTDPDIRAAAGRDLPRLMRARRIDHYWSGVRNDLLYGAWGRAALSGLLGVVAYPDALFRPQLVARFFKSLVVRS